MEGIPVDVLRRVTRIVNGERALQRWAVATLVANIVIVITGGLVRLTGSGLGCPTWPKCTEESYVSHPELGYHGLIEFANRLLTFALIVIAALTLISAVLYRENGAPRRDLRWLAAGLALGIPAQAVIGGLSVLYELNPYIVALHLLASMILICLAVWLVRKTWRIPVRPARRLAVLLSRVTFASMAAAIVLGTLVTGSGPHAGDEKVARSGLDGLLLTRLHASAVYLTVVVTLLCLILLRSRAAALLLAVEVVQATIGVTQYYTGVPIWLVALHLLGAALSMAAATNLMLSVTRRRLGRPEHLTPGAVPAAAVPYDAGQLRG
jgi:heme a synthase